MKRDFLRLTSGLALLLALAPGWSVAANPLPFEWRDGDRVVLIGDTTLERDQSHGYLETLISSQNPGKSLTFRNLAWSGDTVLGLSRAGFGKPAEGFQQLKDHVLALKPTVLIIGYGMSESFQGEPGLPEFVSGLNTLLDALAPARARLIFLAPIAHEDLGRPLPDPASHNLALEKYRDAIKKTASERGGRFVDLFDASQSAYTYGISLTSNGIHPTPFGFWYLASEVDAELRQALKEPQWEVRVDAKGRATGSPRVKVSKVEASSEGVRFQTLDDRLPVPPEPEGSAGADAVWLTKRVLRVSGLNPGDYTLKIDGKPVATLNDGIWTKGYRLEAGPEFDQAEALRRTINEKNQLYFYRWRPQNETYLFGFRKHEQGNNAREIPLFDPLVEAKEQEIARLRAPISHDYEIVRARDHDDMSGEVDR